MTSTIKECPPTEFHQPSGHSANLELPLGKTSLVAGVGFEPTAPGSSTETVGDSTEVEMIFAKNPKIRSYLLTNSILWYIIY